MRKYFIFEIEADEKPILESGEWEEITNLTSEVNKAQDQEVVAYGQIEFNKYLALYSK
ncbi:hypothetical protein BTS2_3384 [Bacillus sp. TS-2]|nr:hypothetical protein BTS2_3384 [Bacillus sp. TS-2]